MRHHDSGLVQHTAALSVLSILMMISIGCAQRPPGLVYATDAPGRHADVLLGQRGTLSLAQEFAGRSAWPALDDGYEIDVASESFEFRVNDQSFDDRLGGGFYQSNETFRHRMSIR